MKLADEGTVRELGRELRFEDREQRSMNQGKRDGAEALGPYFLLMFVNRFINTGL